MVFPCMYVRNAPQMETIAFNEALSRVTYGIGHSKRWLSEHVPRYMLWIGDKYSHMFMSSTHSHSVQPLKLYSTSFVLT